MGEISSYQQDILNIFQANLPWGELSGCNILITGATGLIGGCLVETLMMNPKRDYQVYASGRNQARAMERFKDFANDESFHFLKYDVIEPLDSDIRFDYIIHAASNGSPNFFAQKPVEVMKSNLYGLVNLMEYGLAHGMKRMLYVSSGRSMEKAMGVFLQKTIAAMWIVQNHVLAILHQNDQQKLYVFRMSRNIEQMW